MTSELDAKVVKLQRKLRPSSRTVAGFAVLGGLSFIVALLTYWWPALAEIKATGLPLLALLILLLLLCGDYITTARQPPVRLTRALASGLALNQWSQVQLTAYHQFFRPTQLTLFDGIPEGIIAEGARRGLVLQPQQHSQVAYRLRPLQRGPLQIHYCHIQVAGPMGFWLERYKIAVVSDTKVYPNFSAITAYTLLASENHTSALGIRTRSRRGQGSSFHQLREYRQGDSLRQLDWNATAKRLRLISKEYQDERDQNLLLMIDSGRRMHSQDGELSQFDHALNASILLSYIALRQGDSVGLMSFGNDERWIAPQKGADRVKVMLNNVYDLQAGNKAPDYLAAAERLISLQRKRSLVILITNSRDEEIDELLMAVRLLKQRHLVLLANIRESELEQALSIAIDSPEQAARYAGTVEYLQRREAVRQQLRAEGVFAVDASAANLPAMLANSYWEIKRAGML